MRSPCPNDGTCTCNCHGLTCDELATMDRYPWEDCCGPWLSRGLIWPDPPAGLDDWPTCGCGSGNLVTGFDAEPATDPQVTLYSSRCCLGWVLRDTRTDRHREGPLGVLAGWAAAVARIGGYPTIHAINRGEVPPEPDRHEEQLSDSVAQPALF